MGCVVISGCSSGFGLETALAFGRRGAAVVAGLRSLDNSAAARRFVEAEGLPVRIRPLDVTDPVSVATFVEGALSEHGAIDTLVNNAGIGAVGALEETAASVVQRLFEVNVFGLLELTRAVLPSMRAAGRGVLVNVGSIQGLVPVPFFAIYAATKAAVEALTESLHYEIEPFGLRAVVVEPGRFRTAFVGNLVSERSADSPYNDLARSWYEGWSKIPGREALPPASFVADAIVRAATDPECPRHLPVGPDVEALAAKRRVLDDESFETYLREITRYRPEVSKPSKG